MREIIVLGIGGSTFARIDLAKACGYEIGGLYHYNSDRTGQLDHGYIINGSFEDLFCQNINGKFFLLTMGDMKIRQNLYARITAAGGIVPTLIHPKAEVSEFANISHNGVMIDSQAIVQSDCNISDGVFICAQAMICHQTTVGPYVFIAPKAIVGARLKIEEFSFIGQNATIISTKVKKVGRCSLVGAGSVVTKCVEDNSIVLGNPARQKETGGGRNQLIIKRLPYFYSAYRRMVA